MASLGTYFYLDANLEVVCPSEVNAIVTTTTSEPCCSESGFSQETLDSISWLPLVTLFLFKFSHAFGLGPLAMMMMGEFFSSEAKDVSSTFASTYSQICGFLISKFQVNIEDALTTAGLYYLYAGFAAMSIFYCHFVLPETLGRSAKDMKSIFNNKKKQAIAEQM